MPNRRLRRDLAGASLALLALSACVPRVEPPAPLPAPAPAPRPAPPSMPPAPSPAPIDWETGPASPGDWSYRRAAGGPTAIFDGAGYGLSLMIGCMPGRIAIVLNGAESDAIIVRTSFGQRQLPALHDHRQTSVSLPASDPLLDQMAFSRGRFLISVEGGPSLVVPAWPELARVVEDCRGP